MRRFWLTCISLLAPGVASAAPQAIVVELRLNDATVEALAWRDDAGAILVEPGTLTALSLAPPDYPAAQIPLSAVRGLSYQFNQAESAVEIECAAACFNTNVISDNEARGAATRHSGGFFNLDLAATSTGDTSAAAGLFELGLFSGFGAGGTTWTADTQRGRAVRLETQWTIDRPNDRTMIRLGDSLTRGGATGAPVRLGGVQFATDFSLDPGFVVYPTPTLRGEAAAPSTIDLYVDGALRLRSNVGAGPFSIPDAPVLTGAGVAQVVVTDALGRQQVFAQSFYASPTMLRRGLADYSVAIGAERENFTQTSDDYGRNFISGVYRRGLSNWLTAEARAETATALTSLGAAVSLAAASLGQIDLGYVRSNNGAHDGHKAHTSWRRQASALSLGLDLSSATRDFRRLGEDWGIPPARLQAAASAGLDLQRFGAASLAYTLRDVRDHEPVRTIAFAYTPRLGARGQLNFNALYVDDEETEPYLTVGAGYALTFDNGISVGASAGGRGGRGTATAEAQRTPDLEGGFGWRAGASLGAIERADASVLHLGRYDESSLEFSHTEIGDGLRAQLATALAWMDDKLAAARPIRDSFALVDVGAPNVTVLRDRRPAGITDQHGIVLLTGLRPYQSNRIGLDLDDLPLDAQPNIDEIEIIPAAHSGVAARFPVARGAYGEARVLDATGAPLPAGAMLVRRSDGQRFPVGYDGRIYISGLARADLFAGAACALVIRPADLGAGRALQCRPT